MRAHARDGVDTTTTTSFWKTMVSIQLQKNLNTFKIREKMTDNIEEKEDVSSALVEEMIWKWIDLQNFAEKYHPDTDYK